MHELIEHLKTKQWLWQGNQPTAMLDTQRPTKTGYPELDQRLEGGFPEQGVVDLQSLSGIGELRLLFPHLQLADDGRLIVFIHPPAQLNADTLAAQQLDTNRVLLIQPQNQQHAYWAAEQCLKSGACSHVFLWCDEVEIHQARRFQVGCEMGRCRQFLLRQVHRRPFTLPVSLSMKLLPDDNGVVAKIIKRKGHWEPQPFNISMSSFWPKLVRRPQSNTVVPFPIQKRG